MKRLTFLIVLLFASTAFAQNQRVSGTLSALGQSVCLTELDQNGAISVQAVSPAAWDATVQFYVSNNGGTNEVGVSIEKESTGAPVSTQALFSAAGDGIYRYNATGFRQFCAKVTFYVSGSVNLIIEAGSGATTPTKNVNAVMYQSTTEVGGANPMWVQGDVQVNAGSGNRVDGSSSAPVGTEYGLIVRNIPSGTQAVSGPLTDTQLRATPVPVSGTVTATGPLTDTQLRATPVPVSGTVTATGPLTDTQLRASAVPVTANAGTNLNTSALALSATQTDRTQKSQITDGTRDGTVKAASTAAAAADTSFVVGLSPNSPLPTGANAIGSITNTAFTANAGTNLNTSALFLDATYTGRTPAGASPANGESNTIATLSRIGTFNYTFNGATWDRWTGAVTQSGGPWTSNVTQFGGSNVVTGTGTGGVGIPRVTVSNDSNILVTPPTLTKGTQSANGFSVQDLKDAGRTLITFTADNVVPILTTDTIVTFTKLVGDTSTATQTTYAVTSGKTLRITSLTFNMVPSAATVAYLRLRLRTNSGGACVAGSTLVGLWSTSSPPGTIAANAGGITATTVNFPEGLEFSGSTRNVCMSMNVLGAAAQTVNITVTGYEY